MTFCFRDKRKLYYQKTNDASSKALLYFIHNGLYDFKLKKLAQSLRGDDYSVIVFNGGIWFAIFSTIAQFELELDKICQFLSNYKDTHQIIFQTEIDTSNDYYKDVRYLN